MAPNQFATMMQRKANRINTILVYAVLEWLLIVLLFLNGLFSYIIRKFAQRFGLRPPCLFCSRVDHLLEQQNNTSNSYGDLMCEAHATEVSKLSYCPSHHKLTEFEHLCTNCLDSHLICNEKVIKLSPKLTSFSWVGESSTKNDCKDKRCSCCDKTTSSCLLFKPSWVVLEHAQKTYLLTEALQENESKGRKLDISKSDIQEHLCEGSQVDEQPSVGRFSFGEAIEECILNSKPQFHSNDIIQNTIQKYEGAKTSIDVSTTTKPMYNEVVNRFSEMSEYSDLDHISLGEVYEDTTVRSPRSLDIHVEGYVVAKPSDYQEYKSVEQEISKLIEHFPGPKEVEVEEEKCWDRSVMSEMESAIGDSTIEKLKSALESERTALKSLQGELEEERNAAAIAANQTLAMITRLQEEKSAMQMEALHYQRMMEEQSEYDQEALQILNDLVIKREKEKLELEKDLEMCQKKVSDYEAKEKAIMNNSESLRSNSSIASSSNMDDEDELYIDFIHDEKVDNHCSKDNTHELVSEMEEDELECMKHLSILDESIAQFEDERTSILEELKALEEKLFTLADNNEEIFEDRYHNDRDRDVHYQEVDAKYKFSSGNFNVQGDSNKEDAIGSTAKTLLPLFDATCFESDSEANMKYESVRNDIVKNTFSREDEIDHVYRRLQALEADKDFLKHCFSSLKQGDKGRELLEEILEHFWDLRTVEIQVRRNRGNIQV